MNANDIILQLEDFVERKIPLAPSWWLEQARKLVVLMGDETDLLHSLQKKVAQEKIKSIEAGKSVAEAKVIVEAQDCYEEMQKQKSKCERITEIIRIAKIQSRLREGEFGSGNL